MITNISGFKEFLPHYQITFNKVKSQIETIFLQHGFIPIDTTAVELASNLLHKGNDKEIYGVHRLKSEQDKDSAKNTQDKLALRFDLTVPLARYISQNYGKLSFPYKRFHIAPVWRGERSQAGRYRQFYQCDIDIINENSISHEYDAEILFIAYQALNKIGLDDNFNIKINSKKILIPLMIIAGAIDHLTNDNSDTKYTYNLHISDNNKDNNKDNIITNIITNSPYEQNILDATRILDKADKIPEQKLIDELRCVCPLINEEFIKYLITNQLYNNISSNSTIRNLSLSQQIAQHIEYLEKFILNSKTSNKNIAHYENALCLIKEEFYEIEQILKTSLMMGLPESIIHIDLSLARGLNYYSGIIFEVVSKQFPEIGSICAGGRYDNLVNSFIKMKKFPGVGMSIGISRLIPKMIEIGIISAETSSTSSVIILQNRLKNAEYDIYDPMLNECFINAKQIIFNIHKALHNNTINAEIYWGEKDLTWQMKYSNKRSIPFVIIVDIYNDYVQRIHLRSMITGFQKTFYDIKQNINFDEDITNKLCSWIASNLE